MSSNITDNSKSYLRELVRINKFNLTAFAYEALDVSSAGAKSLTVPTGAVYAEIRVESSVTLGIVLRYLMLGANTLPTSTVGLSLSNLDYFDITGYPNLLNFRVILTQAGTHTVHVQYYR